MKHPSRSENSRFFLRAERGTSYSGATGTSLGYGERSASDGDAHDRTLLARVACDDSQAFNLLYLRFAPSLQGLLRSMWLGAAEADDVLQEGFVAVWRNAKSYRADRASPFTWVATVVRRRALDLIRSRNRRVKLLEKYGTDEEQDILPRQVSAGEEGERTRALRSALPLLKPAESVTLLLIYFEGMTHREVAALMCLPVGTVKSRTKRGLSRLRQLVKRRER